MKSYIFSRFFQILFRSPFIFSVAWVILLIPLFLFLAQDSLRHRDRAIDAERLRLEDQYELLLVFLGRLSEFVYEEHLNTEQIKSWMSSAWSGNSTTRQHYRKVLYQDLAPLYQGQLSKDFRQVHFHFPDNTSFLRMHRPDRFGDDLTGVRETVRIANQDHKRVFGFEEGRVFNGFRYVFPLEYRGRHIGTVEVSLPVSEVKRQLLQLTSGDMKLILKKSIVERKVFQREQSHYIPAKDLSFNYYYENPQLSPAANPVFPQKTVTDINRKISPAIQPALQKNQSFSRFLIYNREKFLIHFLLLKSFNGEPAGYLVSYQKAPEILPMTQLIGMRVLQYLIITSFGILLIYYTSARVRLRMERFERSLLVSRYLEDGVIFLDDNGKITYVNPAFVKMTGLSRKKIEKSYYTKIFKIINPVNNNDESTSLLSTQLHRKQKFPETYWYFSPISGSRTDIKLPVEITAIPIVQRKKITGTMVILKDWTERLETEQLREDIDRITRHDLKNPLNLIINLPEIILESESGLSEESAKNLKKIQTVGEEMLRSIDYSLKLVKIERGEYELEKSTFSLQDILEGSIQNSVQPFKNSGRTITFEKHPFDIQVRGEPLLLSIAFENLLRNALESNTQRETILTSCHTETGTAVITIHNRTPVPEPIHHKFFEKYVTAEKRHGTGLGTYSAQMIVRLHSGDISMQSTQETGTTITIRLPVA